MRKEEQSAQASPDANTAAREPCERQSPPLRETARRPEPPRESSGPTRPTHQEEDLALFPSSTPFCERWLQGANEAVRG